jgi:multiple sugar transport system permease protein
MSDARALRTPLSLQLLVAAFLIVWVCAAMFPLLWTAVMSFRLPLDALSSQPWDVLLGPATLRAGEGVSALDMALAAAVVAGLAWAARRLARQRLTVPALIAAWLIYAIAAALALLILLPALASAMPALGALSRPLLGITLRHYRAVWVDHQFYRNFENSMIITAGVVTVSLTVGTLAGYGLARHGGRLGFFILLLALVFRALPHSVLVTGYLPIFLGSRELLAPLWNAPLLGPVLHLFSTTPPSLYGQPAAIIIVLVSINQPFTIWMMRSFFDNIPTELDEAARVDGCSHLEAFWRVIMPVMWPGVVTTGLFAFLLAYNDYLVTSLLLDAQSQTMVPAITQFLNRDTSSTDQIEAIAAAVSITAPLFVLVMVFQRQIVSGLTAGAVKG